MWYVTHSTSAVRSSFSAENDDTSCFILFEFALSFFSLIGMSRLQVRAVLLNVPCFVISLISSDIDMNLWFLS